MIKKNRYFNIDLGLHRKRKGHPTLAKNANGAHGKTADAALDKEARKSLRLKAASQPDNEQP